VTDDPERRAAEARSRAARRSQRLEAEIDRLEAAVADRSDRLARARAEIDRLKADRSLGRALKATAPVRKIGSLLRRPELRKSPGAAAPADDAWIGRLPLAAVVARIQADEGPPQALPSVPEPVSIILSVPGGGEPRPELVEALAATAWPDLEWLVATDREAGRPTSIAERLARAPGWQAHVVVGATVDAGVQLAIERATGAFLVFLPAGALPADPGWLARLVAGARDTGAWAASPRVIALDAGAPGGAAPVLAAVQLAARGIAFRPGPGLPVPERLGAGDDAFSAEARQTALRAVPGDVGLLVGRESLALLPAIGTGLEQAVELGLRVREAGGRVAYVGGSVLWCQDGATARETAPETPSTGWADLHARWGPRLHRQVWREALIHADAWATRPLRAAIMGADRERQGEGGALREEIAAGLRSHGWLVDRSDADSSGSPDVVIALDPAACLDSLSRAVVRVGWIGADPEAWRSAPDLADLDLVLGMETAALPATIGGRVVTRVEGPAAVHEAIAGWLEAVRFAIHIGPANWTAAAHWGDTAFARAVARQLEHLGHPSNIVVHAERDDPIALRADVALHIVGTRRLPLRPAQLNLLWIISHPDAVRAERCAAYDLVFVASEPFVEHLREQVGVQVLALHQATDPELFHPEAGDAGPELLFVGNSRNRHRPVLDALAGTTHDLAVYGSNWRPDLLDPRFLRGDWIANDVVHRAYAAAAIVLNDHWPDMRDEGFISNRIYDALASGGFVLTDPVVGLDLEFDGAVATWTDADDLRQSIERYLADPALRRSMSERGRTAVLARHTFAHRAAVLVDAAGPLWAVRPRIIDPGGTRPPA
jgi:Glycosyl transferases group 1